MIIEIEKAFIGKYIIKNKRDRYLGFVESSKSRQKLLSELYHFSDFEWNLFRRISGSETAMEAITESIRNKKETDRFYIVSVNPDIDGKTMTFNNEFVNIIVEGTLLISEGLRTVYYEGEPPHQQFISI